MQDLFKDFTARNKKLSSIFRFSMFDNMYYRSTVWLHAQRTALIIKELKKTIQISLPKVDHNKAYILALVHDDAEMVTGDIQRGHKMRMTKQQLEKLEENEAKAIDKLARKYPEKIGGYNYKELLIKARTKDTLEAQLVNFADKMDAFCECLHELFAGNIQFTGPSLNYYSYHRKLNENTQDLRPLFDQNHPLLDVFARKSPTHVGDKYYQQLNKPHAKESIRQDTDFPWYNHWRKMQLKDFPNGEELLTKKNLH